jgi:hypothetical protein
MKVILLWSGICGTLLLSSLLLRNLATWQWQPMMVMGLLLCCNLWLVRRAVKGRW